MRSPSRRSQREWLSKCTRGSGLSRTTISTVQLLLITIGRLDSVCGDTGTSAITESEGCTIGPPDDNAYAVEPVGVATIKPSARWL